MAQQMTKTRLLPNEDRWEILAESHRYTPDFYKLKWDSRDEFPVFVVGSMQASRYNANKLFGCNYYGKAVTWQDNYIMNRSPIGPGESAYRRRDPVVFQFDKDQTDWKGQIGEYFKESDMKAIEGEVYGVPLRKLTWLDEWEGNCGLARRAYNYITLLDPIQKYQKDFKAFMYLADNRAYMEAFSPNQPLDECGRIRYPTGKEAYRA